MSWVNLDDQITTHPKIVPLSDAAFRLHLSGICYANRHHTDGHLETALVSTLIPRYKPRVLAELVDRKIWVPCDDGYRIHDYLEWNKSQAEITEQRERVRKVRSDAGRKGAAARWHSA